MSYILDALRRADAEREQGQAPGVHTRHTLAAPASRSTARQPRRGGVPKAVAVAGALGVLAAVALAAWLWARDTGPTASPPTDSGSAVIPAPTPADRPPTTAAIAPATEPPHRVAAPPPILAPLVAPVASPPPAAPASASAAPARAAAGAPVAQPGVPPAILAFTDLTAEQRAALPPVNVTGSTYSERAALRTLIVNGQVLQEGDEIAPGLRLEAIEKQSAVLNHRGLRYRVGL